MEERAPTRRRRRSPVPIKRTLMVGLWSILLALSGAAWAAPLPEAGFGYPRDVSLEGWRIDWLIDVTMVFVALLFVIMCIWMAWAYIFHDKDHAADYDPGSSKHSVVVALLISSVIFFVVDGNLFVNSMIDLEEAFWNFEYAEAQPDTVRIELQARQWAWQARYAGRDGEFGTGDDVEVLNDVPIPVDTPIIVHMAAIDVIHSFYLPNLRQKMDAVPGVVNPMWFQATATGEFDIACAQHCGTHHYKMAGTLQIKSKAEFAAWLDEASANAARAYDPADVDAHWGWPWKSAY